MRKTIVAITLVCFLAIVLCGCGGKESRLVGHWKSNDMKGKATINIDKSGDTFFVEIVDEDGGSRKLPGVYKDGVITIMNGRISCYFDNKLGELIVNVDGEEEHLKRHHGESVASPTPPPSDAHNRVHSKEQGFSFEPPNGWRDIKDEAGGVFGDDKDLVVIASYMRPDSTELSMSYLTLAQNRSIPQGTSLDAWADIESKGQTARYPARIDGQSAIMIKTEGPDKSNPLKLGTILFKTRSEKYIMMVMVSPADQFDTDQRVLNGVLATIKFDNAVKQ